MRDEAGNAAAKARPTRRKRLVVTIVCLCVAVVVTAGALLYLMLFSGKPIDIWLIGGQSNAVGYSPYKGYMTTTYDGVRFDSVMYAGEVECQLKDNTPGYRLIDDFKEYVPAVGLGLGRNNQRIGPEFGMAEKLDEYYKANGGRGIILKSASGGTSLQDTRTGLSATYGNWLPRSKWDEGYDPATRSDPSIPTGVQYYRFVENFRTVYRELKKNGYRPRVAGMFWMQGEDDIHDWFAYGRLLEALIGDLREDISSITRRKDDLLMPFVIGEIAVTFNNYEPQSSGIPEFNEMQRRVAEKLDACATVPTADIIICDPQTHSPAPGCPDTYHFSGEGAHTLGLRAADALLTLAK